MPQNCSTNYVCEPIWYDVSNKTEEGGEDIILYASGPHAQDVNVTCVPNTGTVQFQVKDDQGNWFTPTDASYTVNDSSLRRVPRANMPDIRVIATLDAKFYIEGAL